MPVDMPRKELNMFYTKFCMHHIVYIGNKPSNYTKNQVCKSRSLRKLTLQHPLRPTKVDALNFHHGGQILTGHLGHLR
jgi:hypothetical protein